VLVGSSTLKGICASSWSVTKNHCMMHDQQNVKLHKDASSIRCRSPKAVCMHLRLVCFYAVLNSVYQADIASSVYDSNAMERLWKEAVV